MAGVAVSVAEDEEVGELGFGIADITERWGDVVIEAEAFPQTEDGLLGAAALNSGAGGCELERSAEISLETVCVGRCNSFQGLLCG